jgi:hypothetical protein
MRNPILETTQQGRHALPMAVIVNWNGVDLPEEQEAGAPELDAIVQISGSPTPKRANLTTPAWLTGTSAAGS